MPHLFSLPLADGRWFTVLHQQESLDGIDLDQLRVQVNTEARHRGVEPSREHRACLFTVNDGHTRGLIEICTIAA
jgi:hypothetical protein